MAMMMNKIKEYRTLHKKCKWCKYYKYESPSSKILGLNCADYEECILKDKIINYESLPRLCKYYELKEDNNEISTNKSN